MNRMALTITTLMAVLLYSTVAAQAIKLRDVIGKWISLDSNDVIIFEDGGDVIDYRLGEGRFTKRALSYGANMAVVYQPDRWCWYYASITPDGATLLIRSQVIRYFA